MQDLFGQKPTVVYTSRITYQGNDRLDITVKSGSGIGRYFAPTWGMVMGLKKGTISQEQYIANYQDILTNVPEHIWQTTLSLPSITLCCYCKSGDFCHRYILKDELLRRGAVYKGEV